MRTAPALVYDDLFLEHRSSYPHPERPERLTAMLDSLGTAGLLGHFERLPLRKAGVDELTAVHSPEHVERVRAAAASGAEGFDADTYLCAASYEVAMAAAGGLLQAVDRGGRSLCLVRPPGHHATADRAMGFCLFNNVAVAARYAQRTAGVERVAIVDIDVHHGNGTQTIFWDDPSVLYCSMHQMPLYPGSGHTGERGGPSAIGATVNAPVEAGCGDDEYLSVFRERILPAVEAFGAGQLMLSVGFDAMAEDPLAGLELTESAYASVTRELAGLAERAVDGASPGRLLVTLEGGYDLAACGRGICAVARELIGS